MSRVLNDRRTAGEPSTRRCITLGCDVETVNRMMQNYHQLLTLTNNTTTTIVSIFSIHTGCNDSRASSTAAAATHAPRRPPALSWPARLLLPPPQAALLHLQSQNDCASAAARRPQPSATAVTQLPRPATAPVVSSCSVTTTRSFPLLTAISFTLSNIQNTNQLHPHTRPTVFLCFPPTASATQHEPCRAPQLIDRRSTCCPLFAW